jgi:transmembrane sensor
MRKAHNMKVSVNRELLLKYVRKACTVEEQQQIEAFLFQPEWKQALEELLKEDFEAFEPMDYPESDLAVWNQRFRTNHTDTPTSGRFFNYNRWMGYAAACILMLGIGIWYLNTPQENAPSKLGATVVTLGNPRGQRSAITLPDGSVVHLGALSSISYPKLFGTADRAVILTGEAFFEVKPDKLHPFTIRTGKVQTRVLGTSFKIDAFKRIIVSVATGRVEVNKLNAAGLKERSLAVLIPGQKVSYDKQNDRAELGSSDIEEINAWTKGSVTFTNTPLEEIAETLERWYNIDISFANESLRKTRLSLIVKATVPIQHSLDIICSTAHLKYNIKGNKITVTKH